MGAPFDSISPDRDRIRIVCRSRVVGEGHTPVVTWAERAEQWRQFAVWETERLRTAPHDFGRAMTWFAEAWSLAKRCDPSWASPDRAEEHWRYLAEVRAALARIRPRL